MTKFTKADMETEGYAQKLNQMLWSRCKAGKISQTEYTALLENRDINLKRLIAEKNLTLDEARSVRKLVMESHLAMAPAIAVAKDRMTLAQARKESASFKRDDKETKPLRGKPSLQHNRQISKSTRLKVSDHNKREQGERVSSNAKPIRNQNQANQNRNRPSPNQRQANQNRNRPSPNQRQANQNRNRPNPNQNRPDQSQKQPSQNQNKLHQKQKQPSQNQNRPSPNRPSLDQKHRRPETRRHDKSEGYNRFDKHRSPSSGWDSEANYSKNNSDVEYSAHEWHDWRAERNAQMQKRHEKREVAPIPIGQDWYPGMGFRPAESASDSSITPTTSIQGAEINRPQSPSNIERDIRQDISQEVKSASAAKEYPNEKRSDSPNKPHGTLLQKRFFSRVRRFVPSKKRTGEQHSSQ